MKDMTWLVKHVTCYMLIPLKKSRFGNVLHLIMPGRDPPLNIGRASLEWVILRFRTVIYYQVCSIK